MLAVAATFYFWSVIFPRSGGVYVSLSRGLSPGFAFVGSLVETVILLYYAAFAASLIVKVGLSSFFATVGVVAGNRTLLDWAASTAEPSGVFWIGTATLVLAGVLLATGTRRYFSVQKVLFALAVAGTLVLVAVLLLGSRDHLQGQPHRAHRARLRRRDRHRQAERLRRPAASTSAPRSRSWSSRCCPCSGPCSRSGIGGEVKRVRRSQLFGMLGAVVATGLLIALFDGLAAKAFGYEFQGAIGFNSISGIADGSTEAVGRGRALVHRAGRHPDQQRAPGHGDHGHLRGLDLVLGAGRARLHDPDDDRLVVRPAGPRPARLRQPAVPHPGGGHRPVDRRGDRVHVADRLPQHRLPEPDRGPGGGLGGGHGGGDPVPPDPARAVPGLPGRRVPDRRGARSWS